MNDLGLPVSSSTSQLAWKIALRLQAVVTVVSWLGICWYTDFASSIASIVCFFSLLIWQCAMLGFWAGMGSRTWRWPVIAVASPLMGFFSSLSSSGSDQAEFHVFCFGIIGIVALTTSTLRLWKGQLRRVTARDGAADALQFGIKHVFIWTTAIAVFLGVARVVAPRLIELGALAGPGESLMMIVGLAAYISAATVVNVWALLGRRVSPGKGIVLVTITAIAAIGNYLLTRFEGFLIMTVTSQVLILLTMLLLRMQGFRFVKPAVGMTGVE